jgi:hypothetical protein
MIHEFMHWPFDDAALAQREVAEALRTAFGRATAGTGSV